jgi:ATP-binding protein involved in chromosome partitioning
MTFRTYHEVPGPDRSDLLGQVTAQRARVAERLAAVKSVVTVVSGKGGVGKSFTTASLAVAAARRGLGVGVLDADLRSPTVARMLGAAGPLAVNASSVTPATGAAGVRVMSADFLLDDGRPLAWREPPAEGFVWRGAMEVGALRTFLGDVDWEALDLLLVDLPPGADGMSDIATLVPALAGAIAVTIPSDESRRSVARTMRALVDGGKILLGVIENMAGYACGTCGHVGPLFAGSAGADLAAEFGVPLLGRIPFDPSASPGDPGQAWAPVVDTLIERLR